MGCGGGGGIQLDLVWLMLDWAVTTFISYLTPHSHSNSASLLLDLSLLEDDCFLIGTDLGALSLSQKNSVSLVLDLSLLKDDFFLLGTGSGELSPWDSIIHISTGYNLKDNKVGLLQCNTIALHCYRLLGGCIIPITT